MASKILFNLSVAAIAEAILMRISEEQVPSSHRVAARYLKQVTSSNLWPLMPVSALMMFVLLVMILLFSVLTSVPYAGKVQSTGVHVFSGAQL